MKLQLFRYITSNWQNFNQKLIIKNKNENNKNVPKIN